MHAQRLLSAATAQAELAFCATYRGNHASPWDGDGTDIYNASSHGAATVPTGAGDDASMAAVHQDLSQWNPRELRVCWVLQSLELLGQVGGGAAGSGLRMALMEATSPAELEQIVRHTLLL